MHLGCRTPTKALSSLLGPGAEDKVVPADVLLMAGTCIVEEAVLTGESTPQWKMPIRCSFAHSTAWVQLLIQQKS